MGADAVRTSSLCVSPILVKWEGRWYLVVPPSYVTGSGVYSMGCARVASR